MKTLRLAADETAIYVGRGRAPAGMEHAQLGNPFRVGAQYAQGEAAAAYLPYLRSRYAARGPERDTLLALAERHRAGEALVLVCWCAPQPCHAQHIKAAIEALAERKTARLASS